MIEVRKAMAPEWGYRVVVEPIIPERARRSEWGAEAERRMVAIARSVEQEALLALTPALDGEYTISERKGAT